MSKNRLYSVLGIACAAGYGWLFYSYFRSYSPNHISSCIFKAVTGYPCPSCGSTRAIRLLANGSISESIMMNPLGIVIALLMVIIPIWLIADLVLQKQTLYQFYLKAEKVLAIKCIAIPLILLILLNWIWNFNKDL